MSNILDERVVSMQFDNAQFEKNVGTSLNTLDKLHKKLNLTGMSKGLESVDAAAKKCNFAPMSKGIDTVRLKFSAMYTTADHYLRKLLTSVDNFATKFVKSLTIDPVSTGLKEYETQIGAIQTILANTESKGTTLDDVNAALDELNKYADMTIYNFTEMTKNIGTFTAAGVELETSVSAIKGIANLAAVSGSTSQQASTAMYQLSQALAAGRVSLMDWNSVVNAGMGGEVFQNALKRTATVMGTDVDALIKKYGSFRESLTQGEWLTTDVLTKTLEQFTMAAEEGSEQWNEFKKSLMDDGYTEKQAEEILKMANTATDAATKVKTATQLMDVLKEAAQSGWSQTWEYVIGDFEQAKEMWTAVSDELTGLINAMSESRNNLLMGGEDGEYFVNAGLMSNYDKLIRKINEAGVSTESFEETVKKTAKEHGYPIDRMIENYGDLETAIRNNQIPTKVLNEALENLSGTAADLSKIDKVLDFGDTGEDIKEMQQALADLGYSLDKYGIDGIIGEETTAAIKAFQEAQGLKITGILDEATLNALKEATKGVEGLSGECADLIANIDKLGGRELLVEAFANAWTAVKDVFGGVKKAWQEVFPPKSVEEKSTALYNVIETIHGFSEKLLENEEVVDKVKRTFKGLFSVLEVVKTVLGGGIGLAFKALTAVLGKFDLHILDITAAVGDALVKFREWVFENEFISKGFDLLVEGIAAGAIAIRDWVKAFLELPQVSKALAGIKDFFGGGFKRITEFIARFQKLKELGDIDWGAVFKDFKTNVIGYFTNFDYGGVFKGIKNFFTNLKNKVSEYFNSFDITGSFSDVFDRITEFFSGGFERVAEFISRFKKLKELGKIDWGVIFKDFKANVLGYFANFDYSGILEGIKTFFTDLKDAITERFKNFDIKTTFTTVVEKIRNFFSEIFESIGAWFNGSNLDASFDKGKEKLYNIFDFIKDILPFFKAILPYAPIIAAGVIVFRGIKNSLEFIKNVVQPIAGVVEAVNNISGSIERLAKAKSTSMKMQALGQMLLMIGGSILIIAKAIEILGNVDISVIKQGGIAVGIITGVIAGMMVLSKFLADGYNSFEFGSMVLKIAASIFILAYAIKTLGSMDPSTLDQGMETITKFLLGIAGMMAATKLLGGDSEGFGKMMFKLASSLLILSLVIKILGGMDPDKLGQGMKAIAAFMGITALMMLATKLLTKDKIIGNSKTTSTFIQFGKMMLALSASLLLMAAAVAILGNMDREAIIQGGIAVAAFFGITVGMMAATKLLAKDMPSFAGTMFSLGAALLLMSGAIAILGNMDTKTLAKGGIAVAGLLGMMVGMMAATKLIGTNAKDAAKVGVMMLAFSGAMIIMAGAIKILSGINTKDLVVATLVISAVGGMFAVMTQATKHIKGKTMGSLIVLTVAVGLLATALYVLAGLDTKKLLGASAALAIVMGAFAVMTTALKAITGNGNVINGKTLATLGVMAVIVGALGLVVYLLANNIDDPDGALKSAIALSAIIVALSGACAALSIASKYAPRTKKGLVMLAGVMTLVGGFAAIAIAFLPKIGKQLSSFMTELGPFIDGAKDLGSADLSGIKTLGEAILYFAGASAILAVANFVSFGSGASRALSGIIEFIKEVVPLVRDVALSVSGKGVRINTRNLNAIVQAVKGLAEAAAAIPNTVIAGAFTKFGGAGVVSIPNIQSFKKFIVEALPIVRDVALAVSGANVTINTANLNAIIDAISSLATIAGNVPTTTISAGFGKFKGFIAGGLTTTFTDLAAFGQFISAALTAVSTFMENLTITDDNGKAIRKLGTEELAVLGPVCMAINMLAVAASMVPEKTVVDFWSTSLFSKFGNITHTTYDHSADLKGFANFIGSALNAVSTFMENLTITDENDKVIRKIGTEELAILGPVCMAINMLAVAASTVPTKTVAKFRSGGLFKQYRVFAAGTAWGDITHKADLIGFANFIGAALTAVSTFMENLTIPDENGDVELKYDADDLDILVPICTAIDTLAVAASKVPTETVAKFRSGGLFTKFKPFAVGVGIAWGDVEHKADLIGFANFIGAALTAVSTFMENLTITDENDKAIRQIGELELPTLLSVCDAIATMADAAAMIKPEVAAKFRSGKLFAGFRKAGIGASWGDVEYKTDLIGFANFIGAALTAVSTFMETLTQNVKTPLGTTKTELKFDNGELSVVTTVCGAIKTLAEAAALVTPDVITSFTSGGVFTKFKPFALGVGFVTGNSKTHTDLTGFANFISLSLTAVAEFAKTLIITEEDANTVSAFSESNLAVVTTLCEAVKIIGEAANKVPGIVTGSFGGGGGGGSWLKKGLFGGGGGGSFTVTPMLTEFTGWITETLNALKTFCDSLVDADGTIALSMDAADRAVRLCEAVNAIGGAMEFVPSRTDFEGGFGGAFGSLAGLGGVFGGRFSGSVVPMLEDFKKWIIDILDILPDFAAEVIKVELDESDFANINSLCGVVERLAEAAADAPVKTEYEIPLFGDYLQETDLDGFTTWVATIMPLMTKMASGEFTDEDGNVVKLENVTTENVDKLSSIAGVAQAIAEAAKLAPTKEAYKNIFGQDIYVSTADMESTVEWFAGVYDMINGEEGLLHKLAQKPLNETSLTQLELVANVAYRISETIWNIATAFNTKTVDTATFTLSVDSLWAFYETLQEYLAVGMDLEVINKATNNIAALAKALTAVQNFSEWTAGGNKLDTSGINEALGSMVTAIDDFADAMAGITDPTTAINQIRELSGVVGGLTSISFAGASSFQTALETLGKTGVDEFVNAFTDGADSAIDAAETMVSKTVSAIQTETVYDNFYSAGSYVVDGFAAGISENTWKAEAKAKAMAKAAEEAAKEELQQNSPSKKFIKIGEGVPEGFILGLGKLGSQVKSTAVGMADLAINGTKKAISRVVDVLNSDIDTQPTIRPVIDLSNIESGASSINRMFNMRPSVEVLSNVGAINTMMNGNQNGSNDDVVDAINDLSRMLRKSSGDTYQFGNITYDNGSEIAEAVQTLVRAARVERRI